MLSSSKASIVNDWVSPALIEPKLPAPVDQFGAILEDEIAVELLTAPPSLFSTLTK